MASEMGKLFLVLMVLAGAMLQLSNSVQGVIMPSAGGPLSPCRMYRNIDGQIECVDQIIYGMANIPINDLDGDGDGFYGLYSGGNSNRIKKYNPNKQRKLKIAPRFGRK